MADDLDGDYVFDDAEFEAIDLDTLDELERNAIESTQQPPSAAPKPYASQPAQAIAHAGSRPKLQDYGTSAQPYQVEDDYGFDDDEDVINLDTVQVDPTISAVKQPHRPQDQLTEREHWRQQRYGTSAVSAIQKPNGPAQTWRPSNGLLHRPVSSHAASQYEPANPSQQPDTSLAAMQARILALQQEREALQKASDNAKSAAFSKAGEISIVRANNDKITKEYERRITVMQQLHIQELAKQKSELEISRKEREKLATSNKFLEHDLAQELTKVRTTTRTLQHGNGNAALPKDQDNFAQTPRKLAKNLPFRDGFDDNEVILLSPAKLKGRSAPSTPTKAASKRKRVQTDKSPAKALPMLEPERIEKDDMTIVAELPSVTKKKSESDDKFDFMQQILLHCSRPGPERTMELLNKYHFPSAPRTALSSIILDGLNSSDRIDTTDHLRLHFCELLMSLWSRCLDETYYDPLYDLREMLQYILILAPPTLSTKIIPKLTPLCLATIDLVAFPTAKAARNPTTQPPPSDHLKSLIEPLDYLDLLYLSALNCNQAVDTLSILWTNIGFDFLLLMLHKAQPLTQITLTLHLLTTSALPDSFGPIVPMHESEATPARQTKCENALLDRLTVLLFETPDAPRTLDGQEATYSSTSLLTLRTDILNLLKCLCLTHHGGYAISTHRHAIGRLVRFLHESVVTMYSYLPTHARTTQHVNETVLLLSHFTTCHSSVVDMRTRLAAVPGGSHKHLVSLSRIAFAEVGGVLEAGIWTEAADVAHRMLDEHLSPEEGEAVVEVFSSAR